MYDTNGVHESTSDMNDARGSSNANEGEDLDPDEQDDEQSDEQDFS